MTILGPVMSRLAIVLVTNYVLDGNKNIANHKTFSMMSVGVS